MRSFSVSVLLILSFALFSVAYAGVGASNTSKSINKVLELIQQINQRLTLQFDHHLELLQVTLDRIERQAFRNTKHYAVDKEKMQIAISDAQRDIDTARSLISQQRLKIYTVPAGSANKVAVIKLLATFHHDLVITRDSVRIARESVHTAYQLLRSYKKQPQNPTPSPIPNPTPSPSPSGSPSPSPTPTPTPLPPYSRMPDSFHIDNDAPLNIQIGKTLEEIQNGNTFVTCIRIKLSSDKSPITHASPFIPIIPTGGTSYVFFGLKDDVFHHVRYHQVENCATELGPTYVEGGPNADIIFEYSPPLQTP
jgi:hypothetical protein